MNMWEVKMKVNGVIKTEYIRASSMREAQDIFRKMYSGCQTVLISTVPKQCMNELKYIKMSDV